MDLLRLGEAYSTNYIPTDLIEGYNSLVWTERFQDFGEFELKSFDIAGLSALLPEDTLVSHAETKEVMMVETHEINMVGEGSDAVPEITIRGRSASLILEHRWVESTYQKRRRMRRKYTGTGAMSVLLVQAVDSSSGKDLTRGDDDPETEGMVNDYAWNTRDKIPNVYITEAVAEEGAQRWWRLEEGILWPQLNRIMNAQDLGLRLIRPVSPNPGRVVTVASNLEIRGNTTRTYNADIPGLRFEIYKGLNRTSGPNSVKLSLLQGHLDKPTYLSSKQPYKTYVEIMSGLTTASDVYRSGTFSNEGWTRRVMSHDAGSPELPPEPIKPSDLGRNPTAAERNQYHDDMDKWRTRMGKWRNKRDNIYEEFEEEAREEAASLLKKARRIDMFAGDISDLSPYVYKTHYDLGDTVMLYGDYGKTSPMIVAEYVRTEDIDGDRGFPGLVAP